MQYVLRCGGFLLLFLVSGLVTGELAPNLLQAAPALTAGVSSGPEYTRYPPDRLSYGRHVTDFKTDDFVGSHYCFNCHHLLTDAAGNNVSIISDWRSTMMANAAKDPFWQAKVQSEVHRNPGLQKVIEQKCAVCHMPMAWTQSQAADGYAEAAVLGQGFLKSGNSLHDAAMDGVSCSLCHQVQDKGLGMEETFSGKFKIDTTTDPPDRILYGPYHEVVQKPMRTSIGFTSEYGPQMNHSALCGSCHTLFTPSTDAQSNVVGQFPEQGIFLEWRHSSYNVPDAARYDIGDNAHRGKICQECHMPHSPAGEVIISKWAPETVRPKEHFSQHFFVGGNVFMMEMFADEVDALDLTASSRLFMQTRDRTLDQLQNRSARLSFTSIGLENEELAAELTLESLAGHKYPSGFPSRRLWIHFTVTDSRGKTVFESGKPLANGAIAGNDNDESPQKFEPHYNEITRPDQVQVYEALMRNTDGDITYTLLRANTYAKDNRLLPAGFAKQTAPPAIAVHGRALTDDDFQGGGDMLTYRVKTTGFQGPFTVRAELLYASLSYPFLEDLRKDRQLELVDRFIRMADRSNKMPILAASAEEKIR